MKTLLSIKTTTNNIVTKIKSILYKAAPMILGLSLILNNIQASSCIDRMLSCLHITLRGHSVVSNIIENPVIDPDNNAGFVARSVINKEVIATLSEDFGIDIQKLINIKLGNADITNLGTRLTFDGEILAKDAITKIWENTTSNILDRYFDLLTSKMINAKNNISFSGISNDLNDNFQKLSSLARQLYVREQWLKNSKKILNSETLKKETITSLEDDILFTIEELISPLFKSLTQLEYTFIDDTSPDEVLLIKQSEILEELAQRTRQTIATAAVHRVNLDLIRMQMFAEKIVNNIDDIIINIQRELTNKLEQIVSTNDVKLEVK